MGDKREYFIGIVRGRHARDSYPVISTPNIGPDIRRTNSGHYGILWC